MKYFKSFFKRTWHPQQMDNLGGCNNSSRNCETRRIEETELGELSGITIQPSVTITTPTSTTTAGSGVPCYGGACNTGGSKRQPVHRLESPWHQLKTVFLVSIIAAFFVWLIAYVLLTRYGAL